MSCASRVLMVIVGTIAYFSLAILGSGSLAAFFSHPALVVLAIEMAVLAIASCFAAGSLSPGVREDRSNRWVISAFGALGIMNGYLPAYTDRIDF